MENKLSTSIDVEVNLDATRLIDEIERKRAIIAKWAEELVEASDIIEEACINAEKGLERLEMLKARIDTDTQ